MPVVADLDGDGRMDLTVWRETTGTWYWLTAASGFNYAMARSKQWGTAGDIPMTK